MKFKNKSKTLHLTEGAIIAACYVVLTYFSSLFGLSSGPFQCRLSEALCVLPALTFSAVPGLFAGCVLANIFTSGTVFDILFGSLATLVGALGTYGLSKLRIHPAFFTFPPILANSIIVPLVLKYAFALNKSVWYFVFTMAVGEIISCGILGSVLYRSLYKHRDKI